MACESCKDLNLIGHEEGFILELTDMRKACKYCSLLLSLVQYFAPEAYDNEIKGTLRIDRQDYIATNVEIISATDDYGDSNTLANLWVYQRSGTHLYSCFLAIHQPRSLF